MGIQRGDQLILEADGWLPGNTQRQRERWRLNWPLKGVSSLKRHLVQMPKHERRKAPHRTCHVCKGPLQGTNIGRVQEKELGNYGGSNITESLAALLRQTRCLYKSVDLNLTDYRRYLKELCKYKFSDSISPNQTWLWLVDSQVWNLNLILHYLHQHYRQNPVRTPATVPQGSIECAKRKEWIVESYW